ncbi:MAG: formate dehydrogenase subunit delta [Gallionellaceae bacterium]|nr:formate dehydrogenase subunit delta [Gallionellaceae bacterium]
MNIERLVSMANQIGTFFATDPDADAASIGIAQHLASCWAPSMRQALLDHLDDRNGEGLVPIVGKALRDHRERLAGRRGHP